MTTTSAISIKTIFNVSPSKLRKSLESYNAACKRYYSDSHVYKREKEKTEDKNKIEKCKDIARLYEFLGSLSMKEYKELRIVLKALHEAFHLSQPHVKGCEDIPNAGFVQSEVYIEDDRIPFLVMRIFRDYKETEFYIKPI